MIGYGNNKGIIPISYEEIFNIINQNKDPNLHFEIEVIIVEIYNEKVKDLLMPSSKRSTTGLKIRESKILEIFVEGLTKYPLMPYKEISDKMDEGYKNHIISSTVINVTSSLSHTIATIEFNQI